MSYDLSQLRAHGDDVFISNRAEIRRPHLVSIGSHIAIDSGAYITTGAELGDYIHIGPYVTVIGGASALLRMGHFSGMAAGCRIICASEDYSGVGMIGPTIPGQFKVIKTAPVVIERFVTLGTNAVVMPGVTLGEGSVVGACSLVTRDTEPWTINAGVPAKPIRPLIMPPLD